MVESFRANEGGFTLAHWLGVLGGKSGQRAILTSLGVSAVCATLSLLVGAPLAWLISRMATFPRATWLAVLNLAANFGGIGLAFAFIATMGTYGMVTLALQSLSLPLAMPAGAAPQRALAAAPVRWSIATPSPPALRKRPLRRRDSASRSCCVATLRRPPMAW